MSIYVVGDVHNCYDELAELLYQKIDLQPDDEVYFVGDLFDRGPQAAEVFYWLSRHIDDPHYHFCMGNHDEMMLEVLRRSDYFSTSYIRMDDGWSFNGALSTIYSWEDADIEPEELAKVFKKYDDKLELKFDVEVNDKLFHIVHAGLPRENSYDPIENYMWSRREFYFGKYPDLADNEFVIFGHTPTKFVWKDVDYDLVEPDYQKFLEKIGFPLQYREEKDRDKHVLEFNHRIMIDTGCVYKGWLSAYRLDDGKVFQVQCKNLDMAL